MDEWSDTDEPPKIYETGVEGKKWGTPEGFRALLDLEDLTTEEGELCMDLFQAALELYFDIGEYSNGKPKLPKWKVWNQATLAAQIQIADEESGIAQIAYAQYVRGNDDDS
jgi:hypothetical protein